MTATERAAQNRRIVANRLYADAYKPQPATATTPYLKPRLAAYWLEQKCAADYALDATA